VAFLYAHGLDDVTTQHRRRMLFLHGMESRYQGTSPAEVEAAARKYARARAATISKSSTFPATMKPSRKQLRALASKRVGLMRCTASPLAATRPTGFRNNSRNLQYIKVGAPGTSGDVEIPGVRHMDLPGALADK